LKPSKIKIYIDTCNGSRLTFTSMLRRYRQRYTSYAVRVFSALASVTTHSPARVLPLREGDADEPLLARKTQQAAFIKSSGWPGQSSL